MCHQTTKKIKERFRVFDIALPKRPEGILYVSAFLGLAQVAICFVKRLVYKYTRKQT
jgi:hypothetical protein